MLDLVRRDPVLRLMPKWLLISTVGAGLAVNVLVYLGLSSRGGHAVAGAESVRRWLLWFTYAMPLAAFLVAVAHARRCRPLDMALPLPAPRLWLAHALAVLLAGVALLLPIVVLLGLVQRWLGPHELMTLPPGALVRPASVLAAYALIAALVLSRRPGLAGLPAGGARAWLATGGLVGVLALSLVLHRLPFWLSLLPAAAAVLLAARTARTMPATFVLAPRPNRGAAAGANGAAAAIYSPDAGDKALAAGRAGGLAAGGAANGGRAVLSKVIWRTVHGSPKVVANHVFVVPFAAVLSGVLERGWGASEGQFLLFLPLTLYLLLISAPIELGRFHALDAWPLSRRRIFTVWALPTWGLIVAGYLLGVVVGDHREPGREQLSYEAAREGQAATLLVPLSRWELAWDGRVPAATAPWGETQPLATFPLWRGGRPVLYKPYSTPAGCSERFVAWQIARAAEAVYGRSFDSEALRTRYLTTDAEGHVALRTPALSLARDDPGLRPALQGPRMPLVMLLVGVPWALLLALGLRLSHPGVNARARRVGWVAIVAGVMALHLVGVTLAMSHVLNYDGLSAAVPILARRWAAALPGGAWAVWAIALVALAALWRWVAGQFARVEFAPAPRRDRESA